MRYLRQPDLSSCSPIAIMNALKWQGYNVGIRDLKKYKRYCKCGRNGTNRSNLKKIIVNLFKVCLFREINKRLVDNHLKNGGSVILDFVEAQNGHTVFIIQRDKKNYHICNFQGGNTVELVNNSKFYRIWRKKDKLVWLLDKE